MVTSSGSDSDSQSEQDSFNISATDLEESASQELEIYHTQTEKQYTAALEQSYELVEYVFEETNHLLDLSPRLLQRVPEAIRVCREVIRSPISQYRLGQVVGTTQIGKIEDGEKDLPSEMARTMYRYFRGKYCSVKVPWLAADTPRQPIDKESDTARTTIASAVAKTRSNTMYRTYRQRRQEGAIMDALTEIGYQHRDVGSELRPGTVLNVGEFTTETTIGAGGEKKADVIFCPSEDRVVLVEAKVCGIAVDGFKRISEIKDKKERWSAEFSNIDVVAVMAGALQDHQVTQMLESGIGVFLEHQLERLQQLYALPEGSQSAGGVTDRAADAENIVAEMNQTFTGSSAELGEFVADGGDGLEVGELSQQMRAEREDRSDEGDSVVRLSDFQ